jgi:hypothetical protein
MTEGIPADDGNHRWPGRVAVGVIRSDPPQVFLASTEAALGQLLATKLVAPATAHLSEVVAAEIQAALSEERWTDAIVSWMQATGEVIDAYPDEDVVTPESLETAR